MKEKTNPKDIFLKYFPENAVEYCFQLWVKNNFHFRITRKRNSKFGDYTYDFASRSHTITINADLNPFAFLITYLHEIAHLMVRIHFTQRVAPHGPEWKNEFRKVASPMLSEEIFPKPILKAFVSYLHNPKASSCSDPALFKVLHAEDNSSGLYFLSDLNQGQKFILNHKYYLKEETRRTRTICKELKTGKKYLISNIAKVTLGNEN